MIAPFGASVTMPESPLTEEAGSAGLAYRATVLDRRIRHPLRGEAAFIRTSILLEFGKELGSSVRMKDLTGS